jgi:1L-myo-inositol 1-phosphate cytidylyltransferase / CDP-L-myo-inositol myo-inositolphosphotransferase
MEAVIVGARSPLANEAVLGLSLLQRAAFAALDAGAQALLLADVADAAATLSADPRCTRPVRALDPAALHGPYLLVRADALVAAPLLTELELGEGIVDRNGVLVAARMPLSAGDDPAARLAAATPRAFAPDRHRYALAVTSRAQLSAVRSLLLESLIKASDGPVSRHLNRHLSRAITRVCLPLGVTPNQMTMLVALAGLAAGYYAAQPSPSAQLLGALLFQLHSVIDGCDGEIARLTRNFGKHGALIDSLVDDASNLLFFAGLSCGVAGLLGVQWPLYTGALTVACYAAVAYIQYAAVLRSTGKGEKTAFWRGEIERRPLLLRALHALGRRDVFVLVILVAVALGLAKVVVAVLPLMAVGALAQSVQRARAAAAAG